LGRRFFSGGAARRWPAARPLKKGEKKAGRYVFNAFLTVYFIKNS